MQKNTVKSDFLHEVPADLQAILQADSELSSKWESLTPLARNEWICWLTVVKKAETRQQHLHRLGEEILAGERRPCCWPGCPHRNPSAAKWFQKSSKI